MKTRNKKRRAPNDADKRSLAIFHGALAVIAKHKALDAAEAETKRTHPVIRHSRKLARAMAAEMKASCPPTPPNHAPAPVAFKLQPRNRDYKVAPCGCCSGKAGEDKCVCFAHQDMPHGIRPKKCSMHRKDRT